MHKPLLAHRFSRWLAVVFLTLLSSATVWAQSTANYTFATTSTGSLVDMSTGTTEVLTSATYHDDDASAVLPIGFTFGFMGTNYTQFSVNSNGQLRLGATAIAGGSTSPTAGAAILAPMGGDNAIQATGKLHYKVVAGTNRTLVIEWNSLRIPFSATAGTGSVVQAILEENTGKVEYRYGAVFNNSTTALTRSVFISAGTSAGQIGVVTNLVTTPAYDATATSATTSTFPLNSAVPVLNSTADGSRTVFTFTPLSGTPAAPSVATSAIGQTGLTLNITDNSTNEGFFSISRSTDNTTFTTIGTVTSTTTAATGGTVTVVQTGLLPGTTYYYRVTANNEAGGASTNATVTATTVAAVPLCGTKSVGPGAGADYPSLTAAFTAINVNGLCGPLVLELQAAYVSTVETFPLVYNTTITTATNTVTVRPAAGATNLSITGTTATAVFNIFGGKYLILDGRPGGSGATVSGAALATDLTIASTNTNGIPMQLTSDATFNVVQHTQIVGVGNNVSSYPNVNFTGTTTTLGNSDNTLQYNNVTAGATTPVSLLYSGSSLNSRNSIVGNNFSNYYLSGGSAYGININTAGTGWVISGNSIYQTASRTSTAGTLYGINIVGGSGYTITNNFIGGTAPNAGGTPLTATGTAAAFRFSGIFLTLSGAASSVQGNTIANINWVSSSGASTTYGIVSGIYISAGDANIGTVTGNTVGTATGPITVSTSTSGGYSFGISSASSGTVAITGNTISNITGVGSAATVASNVAGILVSAGTTNTISRNKIYTLASGSGVGNLSTGIWLTGGTTNTVVNNLIGDLQSATSTSLVAVSGILIGGGTTDNIYNNTINLSATSTGATFGTSGIYLNSLTATADLRNNIVVNKSTAVGTGGYTAALRRVSGTAGTVPSNLAATSNNNLYYAGTPSATNVIYIEGTTTATNAQQTLLAYKGFMGSREQASVTEDVPFVSTAGAAATFLHINPSVATQVEGNGTPIASVTTDFDGDTRSTTAPDLGADEGTFTPSDQSGPTIAYTPLANANASVTTRTITATITDISGIGTGANAPLLFYRKSTSSTYLSAAATSVSGSAYTFTIDYAALGGVAGGTTIQYYIAAQDALGNSSTNPGGGTYTTAPPTPNRYLVLSTMSGIYYVGTSTSPDPTRTYATLTAAASAYNVNNLGGAVTFLLLDATYSTAETFPIIFGSNPDASATNTLTVRPNTSIASSITGSNATAILALNGADYVTLDGSNGGTISATDTRPSRNLTVTNTNASATSFVVLVTVPSTTDNATNNTVKNLNAVGSGAAATQVGIAFLSATGGTGGNNNNLVQNNTVQAAQYGIYSYGVSATVKNTGTVITQNDLNATGTAALGRVGIVAGYEDGIQITRNVIDGIIFSSTGDVAGISAGFGLAYSASTFTGADVTNATISRNTVGVVRQSGTYSAVGIGLVAATSGTSTIDNNFVSGVASNGTTGDFGAGILVGGGTGSTTRVVFNSVSMTNPATALTGGNYPGFALAIGGSTPTVEIRNNILVNTQTTGSGNSVALGLAYSSTTGAYAGLTSTNNDLFVGTGATFAVGQTGSLSTTGVLRTTLAALNTETGQDSPTTSKSVDPQFISSTDLHSTSNSLNNAGVPVAGITVDIDGETRSATTPDIGADEFTPPACQAVTGLAFATVTSTTASITFTAPTGGAAANSYTVTYTPAGGTATTITPNPTASPIPLSGLTPNTVYTVTVTTNCTGATSPSATGTFTTLCSPPAYAALPISEGFENTWISRCDTREVPTANWLNTPTTGNNSWRRDDDGAAAGWTSPTLGAYTPAGSQSSSHSARFHSYYAASGAVGTFDLYADLSAAGSKRLTFDYVNVSTSGSKIEVLLSTDGGATFSTTPLLTVTTAATFTAQSLDLTATSATSVIRFKATSDFGSYDIGVDNVQLRMLAAVDLAATALATPTSTQGCYGSAEAVTVIVTNQGTQALDFSVNPATVTAVVTTPGGPQTLTGSITTGTLAAGATQNVTLAPTLDMTAVGTYGFAITATVTGDGYTANDLLVPAPTRTVTAPVAGTLAPAATSICVSGTAALTLTGAANGSIQYQSSTSATGTFTDIAGATSATYTTPVLTSTTYYRAQVRCGASVATSNVSTITVNNPLVATTNTPVAICAGSTATLTATASTGANVRFFDAATGGTALTTTTAGSYTTPALTANATYYAEAFSGGSEVVGQATTASTSSFVGTNYGLVFTTTGPVTLQSTVVYPVGTGTITLAVLDANNAEIAATAAISVTGTGATTPVVVPLNLLVPTAGSGYKLVVKAYTGITGLFRDNPLPTGVSYPLTSPSGALSLTAGYTGSASATTYYFFYNISISTECAGAIRTPIQVNVTQPATASFPAATAATCGASAYTLGGTVGGSVTTGTYTSSGTGTFAPNATTLGATYTPSAADIAAGSVTITLTSATPASCAAATATLALSINPAQVATFSYPAATTGNCAGSTGTVVATLGTGATAGAFTSTTGLTIDAATGAVNLATSTAGTYTVTNTVAATSSCAAATATATITVNPTPVRPTLSATYTSTTATLTSSAATGNQFYLGGVLIPGATGTTYVVNGGTAAQLGSYTVVVSNSFGCSSQASLPLIVTGTKNSIAGASVRVYPNPTPTGQVTLELSGFRVATQLTVFDALGRVITSELLPANGGVTTHALDLSKVASGVYTLRLTNTDGVETRRLVRE